MFCCRFIVLSGAFMHISRKNLVRPDGNGAPPKKKHSPDISRECSPVAVGIRHLTLIPLKLIF